MATLAQDIPPITHPLGVAWDQPSCSEILIDNHVAVMTQATFDKLLRYDETIPTGVYAGKMWGRVERVAGPLLCWFTDKSPGTCVINVRPVLFVD